MANIKDFFTVEKFDEFYCEFASEKSNYLCVLDALKKKKISDREKARVAEEILQHEKCSGRRNDFCCGICIHERKDAAGMVRLHMLYDQIVRNTLAQSAFDMIEPSLCKMRIHRIHDGDLLIQDDVGIICHAVGNGVFSLKKINVVIVYTHILDRI